MPGAKLPAIHLYPGDWLRDSVSGCSLAAQGLWLRMMFVAHDAPEYGHIFACDLLDAKRGIARRCGCTLEEFEAVFSELCEAGVPGIKDGIVYSRRMIRDASLREIRAKAGRKGGKQSAKQKSSKPQANGQAKGKQNTEDEIENDNEVENEAVDEFELFWKVYPSGRKGAKKNAKAAFAKARKEVSAEVLIAAARDYAQSDVGRSEFVKGPAPWLNGGCWDDDRESWRDRGSQRTKNAALDYLEM